MSAAAELPDGCIEPGEWYERATEIVTGDMDATVLRIEPLSDTRVADMASVLAPHLPRDDEDLMCRWGSGLVVVCPGIGEHYNEVATWFRNELCRHRLPAAVAVVSALDDLSVRWLDELLAVCEAELIVALAEIGHARRT